MGSFNDFLDAEFRPPRNWSLNAPLKFKSETLTNEERELLVECGIQVTKTTKNITVPKGYITDLASVPRVCWAFIAHFDCARAAADAAYALMQGQDLDESLDNQEHVIIYDWTGNQDVLLDIVQNYDDCKDDCDILFASVFFEEVMLKHLINGKIQ